MKTEEAIAFAQTEWWVGKSAAEIVKFQVNEPLLCMPFGLFHAAVEEVVGEPVFSHMFASTQFIDYVKKLVDSY